ncbi:MAG: hypothetical protein R2788_13740 [Saprospiraceae bacterium]
MKKLTWSIESFVKKVGLEKRPHRPGSPAQLGYDQSQPGGSLVSSKISTTIPSPPDPADLFSGVGLYADHFPESQPCRHEGRIDTVPTGLEQPHQDRPFTYEFMDDHFAQLYLTENRLGRLLLGGYYFSHFNRLFGFADLVRFYHPTALKEIGIRKVLGMPRALLDCCPKTSCNWS